jgi:hypothetical protein
MIRRMLHSGVPRAPWVFDPLLQSPSPCRRPDRVSAMAVAVVLLVALAVIAVNWRRS